MPHNSINEGSTLVQLMAWFHNVTNHYLNQCWLGTVPPYGDTKQQSVNMQCLCIHGLVQERHNSIAIMHWVYVSLALTHRYHDKKCLVLVHNSCEKEAVFMGQSCRICTAIDQAMTHWNESCAVLKYVEGILSKGPYLPCVSMAGRALLAGYHRYKEWLGLSHRRDFLTIYQDHALKKVHLQFELWSLSSLQNVEQNDDHFLCDTILDLKISSWMIYMFCMYAVWYYTHIMFWCDIREYYTKHSLYITSVAFSCWTWGIPAASCISVRG